MAVDEKIHESVQHVTDMSVDSSEVGVESQEALGSS